MKKKKTGRENFNKYKVFLIIMYLFFRLFPKSIRNRFFELSRFTTGKIGFAIRYSIIKSINPSVGDNIAIYTNVIIINPQNLNIGNNVSIHPMSYIDATGGVKICNNVSIAHGTSIISSSHSYVDPIIPIKYQPIETKPIIINENVWIGAKVTILYGVVIGSGSIIGANALVNKSFDSNVIIGGVPAKIIKQRFMKVVIKEEEVL